MHRPALRHNYFSQLLRFGYQESTYVADSGRAGALRETSPPTLQERVARYVKQTKKSFPSAGKRSDGAMKMGKGNAERTTIRFLRHKTLRQPTILRVLRRCLVN